MVFSHTHRYIARTTGAHYITSVTQTDNCIDKIRKTAQKIAKYRHDVKLQ